MSTAAPSLDATSDAVSVCGQLRGTFKLYLEQSHVSWDIMQESLASARRDAFGYAYNDFIHAISSAMQVVNAAIDAGCWLGG